MLGPVTAGLICSTALIWIGIGWLFFIEGPDGPPARTLQSLIGRGGLIMAAGIQTFCTIGLLAIQGSWKSARHAAALADQEHTLLKAVLSVIPASVQVKDASLRFVWMNDTHLRTVPFSAADLLGRTIAELDLHPILVRQVMDDDQQVLRTGLPVGPVQQTVPDRFGGQPQNASVFKTPILRDGQVTHIVTFAVEMRASWEARLHPIRGQPERDVLVLKVPIHSSAGSIGASLTVGTDVTTLERAEVEADKANRLIEEILRHVPLSIHVKDRDGRYRWANRMFGQSLGLEVNDILEKTVHDLAVPPFAKDRTAEQDRAVLTTCRTIRFTEHWIRNGVPTQMMVIKAPMLDDSGAVTQIITIGADVSEIYRLRAEADEARRRLQQIVDVVPVMIVLKDRDRRYRWVNREVERVIGSMSAARLIGRRAEDVFTPSTMTEDILKADESVLRTGQDVVSLSQQFPDAQNRMRDYSVRRVALRGPEGTIDGVLTVGVDITELQRAAQALQQVNVNLEERAEARARELARANDLVAAVLECAPVPVMTMGPDGCVTGWNPAAERITGFSAAEVMGRRPLLSTADRDDLAQALHLVLRGKTVTNKDMRQQRKDGSEIELMVSAAPLRNADGAVEGVVVIGLDVTELRATARQLQQAQKMEAVGQLTGGIAHEFNNLLAVIMGALDLLRLDLPADSNADALVGQAIAAVERGANLTTRLLAFARRQALRPSCTRVDRLVRELMPTLRTLVGETITVRELPTGAVWPTLVDRHQLTSAIVNVVANARDAMPKGGLLTLETCNAMLDATDVAGWPDATPGEFVTIRITDTGHGIEPETQARVFEPFFTTRAIGHGSGLGLSMVLGFVKQSGGHVRLSSTPGLGTTVVLYLPRLVAETAARPDLVSPDAGLAATGNSGPT